MPLVKEYLGKEVTFIDSNGTVSDPAVAVRFYLKHQNATDPTEYVYLTDSEVTKTSTGVYEVRVPIPKSGQWWWRIEGEWSDWLVAHEDVLDVPKSKVF